VLLGAVVCCLAALLAACGVPGEPLPPLLEIPEPARDLAAEQVGARLILRFTRPQLTTEGTRARFLNRLEIYGAFQPPDAPPPSFPEQAQLLAVLSGAELLGGQERITHELPLAASQVGARAFFAIKAINHRGMDAGFSDQIAVEIADLPEAPGQLQATLTEEAIRLSWRPAERSAFGGPAPEQGPESAQESPPDSAGYEVYRAEADSVIPAERIGTTASPSFEDRSFSFGRRYVYKVRAYRRQGDSMAVTPDSASVEVDAVDRFPPAAPQNLRAITVPGGVDLAWSPNSEQDLAGYNIYRSEGASVTRLNQELLVIPLFRDSKVAAGTSYRYHVKAVDREGNEGPASEEAAATGE
jgi:hypothetical protein